MKTAALLVAAASLAGCSTVKVLGRHCVTRYPDSFTIETACSVITVKTIAGVPVRVTEKMP